MPPKERSAQKSRTREAILAGARELIEEGAGVTVALSAKRVGVSRATAYRYFQDPSVLAAEAGLTIEVHTYENIVSGAETLHDKLTAINLYFFDLTRKNEAGFRHFLACSMEATLSQKMEPAARRGARRITMYKIALEEHGMERMPRADILCHSLATATGIEAFVALVDVCGLSHDKARETVHDMTMGILERHIG